MPKFSQRHGYSQVEQAFQREIIDDALRTRLWNLLKVVIWDTYEKWENHYPERSRQIDWLVKRL